MGFKGKQLPSSVVLKSTGEACMMFKRKYGVSAACLYRETTEYNDDRLMYDFLKKYAGEPGKTLTATINQVCPKKLEQFFRKNCTIISIRRSRRSKLNSY